MDLVGRVGGRRLANELEQILREKEPLGAVTRMGVLGLLPFIHPALKLTPDTERVLHDTARVFAWYHLLYLEEHCEQWQVYLLALCHGLHHDEFDEVCRHLAVPARLTGRVFKHRRQALGMLDALQRRLKRGAPVRNSEIYTWFHDLPLEILLYLAAAATREEVKRCVSMFLTRLRSTRCELNGNDIRGLGVKPGPGLNSIMQRLLEARLDGEITSREEEQNLAMTLIPLKNHTTVL